MFAFIAMFMRSNITKAVAYENRHIVGGIQRATSRLSAGRMWPVGHMLCTPGLSTYECMPRQRATMVKVAIIVYIDLLQQSLVMANPISM